MLMARYTMEPEHWKDIHMGVGIQPGTTATTIASNTLDSCVKQASIIAFSAQRDRYDLTFQAKLRKDQLPYNHGAFQPDGGIWFKDGIPILVVEAKYQNYRGNAIERWFKNMYIARTINPKVTYLTFAAGIGVLEGKPIYETLYMPHKGQYNVIQPHDNTAFINSNGFDIETLVPIITDVFMQTIEG